MSSIHHKILQCRPVTMTIAAALVSLVSIPTNAQDATSRVCDPIERFLDADTHVIAWADISKVDLNAVGDFIKSVNGQAGEIAQPEAVREALVQLGVTNVYWVTDLQGLTRGPDVAIVPAPEGKLDAVALILKAVVSRINGVAVVENGVVIAGAKESVDALRTINGKPDADFITTANELAGPHGLTIKTPVMALMPIISVLPNLVDENAALVAKAAELIMNVESVSVSSDLPPTRADFQIVTKSNTAAAELADFANNLTAKRIGDKARSLTLTADGSKVVRRIESKQAVNETIANLIELTTPARKRAGQLSTMNSVKRIALGMHNFHDTYGYFPPQSLADEKGKRLLSWRVLILPFVDQLELYNQFHLDEPWDSPHNKTLIGKMPPLYQQKAPDAAPMVIGKTRFVAPLTEDSVFGRRGPAVKLPDILDGTSNSLLVVEASPEHAVFWTQPEDLVIDDDAPLDSIINESAKGFTACMCDGSARFFARSIDVDILNALLTINGKEPIDYSKL